MKNTLRRVGRLYLFIFIVWGLYRLIFRLPESVEEIILKPLLWLVPTFYIVFKIEKKGLLSLGYNTKDFGRSFLKGLSFGVLFLVVGLSLNYIRYGGFEFKNLPLGEFFWPAIFLSFVTAITEETVFRGYILNRLWEITKSGGAANILSSVGFSLIHLPITIFIYHYSLPQVFIFTLLVFLSSLGSGLLFVWTKNIWASILIHVFWSWPIIFLK